MNDVHFKEIPLHFAIYSIISNIPGITQIFLVSMSKYGRTRSLKNQVKHIPTWRKFPNLESLNLWQSQNNSKRHMALLFGCKKLFIKPETVSFWRLFFFWRERHFQLRQKIIMQFQKFQITCNVLFRLECFTIRIRFHFCLQVFENVTEVLRYICLNLPFCYYY